ncbi:hypothetical protein HPP92_028345, partial [Vanilla planifolia]
MEKQLAGKKKTSDFVDDSCSRPPTLSSIEPIASCVLESCFVYLVRSSRINGMEKYLQEARESIRCCIDDIPGLQ